MRNPDQIDFGETERLLWRGVEAAMDEGYRVSAVLDYVREAYTERKEEEAERIRNTE